MLPMRRSQNWLPSSLFNDFWGNEWMEHFHTGTPAINIRETDKDYEVEIAAPGLSKDDFSIKVNDENQLVISMEKKEEKKDEQDKGKYLRQEFSYSHFRQTMLLPENVERDKIAATMENGVLNISIPKTDPVQQTPKERLIEIQ